MSDFLLMYPEETRIRMIDALQECQHDEGYWCYPPQRNDKDFISVWTTAQVVWALLLSGTRPKYLDRAINILLNYDTCVENGELIGWKHERTDELGISITADCCETFIKANKSECIKGCINKLLDLQNCIGSERTGWGYTISDKTSRVSATCWVLIMLMNALNEPLLNSASLKDAVKSGVRWLMSASSYNRDKEGWGETQDSDPKVSCTAWAIYTLCEAHKKQFIDLNISSNKRIILGSIETIKRLYASEYKCWIGSPEGYGPLKIRGLGSSIVLIALVEAADIGLIKFDDVYISYALQETELEKNGWITPTYKEPQIYENVYWLLALSKLERFYMKYSRSVIDNYADLKRKYHTLVNWNVRIIVWLVICFVGFLMYKVIVLYNNNPIVPILQSIVATIIWELVIKRFVNKIIHQKEIL